MVKFRFQTIEVVTVELEIGVHNDFRAAHHIFRRRINADDIGVTDGVRYGIQILQSIGILVNVK